MIERVSVCITVCVGYLLPLSGGADSAAVAAIVYVMATLVADAANAGNKQVIEDVRKIVPIASELGDEPLRPSDITQAVLHTVYMGTTNSTDATRLRAVSLAQDVGCYHSWVNIDKAVHAVVSIFGTLCGKIPQYLSQGALLIILKYCSLVIISIARCRR